MTLFYSLTAQSTELSQRVKLCVLAMLERDELVFFYF